MKKLLTLLLLVLLSVWLGLKMHSNPGYVLISYNNWTVETTFWVLVFGALILFVLGYLLVRLLKSLSVITKHLRLWTNSRKLRKTIQGLLELAEGNWKNAEKKLVRSVNLQTEVINYLAAAIAAQKQHQLWRRDQYLTKAYGATKKSLAPGIIKARLQLENQQWEEALATLRCLQQIAPRNVVVLGLLQKVLEELQDFEALSKLLPYLRKRRVLNSKEFLNLNVLVHCKLLAQNLQENTRNAGELFWRQLPRALRKNPKLVKIYVTHWYKKNPSLAETLVCDTIKHTWDDSLIGIYGQINSLQPLKQLHRAEGWLKQHPQNATLLLCLGRVCEAQKLWGPARYYLEKSLKISPSTEAYLALGSIMEIQEQTAAAMENYKKAAEVS